MLAAWLKRPFEEHQRPFAVSCHTGERGLHQHGFAPGVQPVDVGAKRDVLSRPVGRDLATARADGRFDHRLRSGEGRDLTGLDEHGGNGRDAGVGQLREVVLVEVPADDIDRVDQLGHRVDLVEPAEELREPLRVVPRRADGDPVIGRPVHARVVPVDHRDVHARAGKSREREWLVLVAAARVPRGHPRQPIDHLRRPSNPHVTD